MHFTVISTYIIYAYVINGRNELSRWGLMIQFVKRSAGKVSTNFRTPFRLLNGSEPHQALHIIIGLVAICSKDRRFWDMLDMLVSWSFNSPKL